jgi:hypothetical protein
LTADEFGRLAPPLGEGPLDMMSGNELADDRYDVGRHWHGLDQITAGIGESLALCWISRHGKELIRRFRRRGAQDHP